MLLPVVQTKNRLDFDDFAVAGKQIHYSNGVTLHLRPDVPFEEQVQEGRPEDFNTKSTLRPFKAWDALNPEAAALWKEVLGELNVLWKEDFYLRQPEADNIAEALVAGSQAAAEAQCKAAEIVAKLDRLAHGDKPLSPLLKQLMTAWEDGASDGVQLFP